MTLKTATLESKTYQKYSKKTLQNKDENKQRFCREFNLKYHKKTALLCLTFPLTEAVNIDMLKDVMGGILEQDICLAVAGIGSKKYEDFFTTLQKNYPKKVAVIDSNPKNEEKMYAASDIFLCTAANKSCQKKMKQAMTYGVIPLAPDLEGVLNYDGAKETGNAFVYQEKSPWSFFAGLIRALENFKFPYDWKAIRVSAMEDNA